MIYDSESGDILETYMYFRTGPFLITDDLDQGVIIDDNIYQNNIQENKEFYLSEYHFKKSILPNSAAKEQKVDLSD